LGTIGKNNLLVAPRFGPRVRLRALLIDCDLPTMPVVSYDPCNGCDAPCQQVCPKAAFASRSFCRDTCLEKMNDDETEALLAAEKDDKPMVIAYCRACELACPIGR
jgi:epoxyqueuosine reductase